MVEHNYTVFYDKDYQHNLVGKDLYSYLREVYREKCKFVVCFISLNYTKKEWTNLELTAIKERFISTFFAADFLIPILIGKPWRIEDIPSYIGFYSYQTPSETAKMLINKFENSLIDVACRAKRKKLTRKMQKSRLKRLENDVPNGIFYKENNIN